MVTGVRSTSMTEKRRGHSPQARSTACRVGRPTANVWRFYVQLTLKKPIPQLALMPAGGGEGSVVTNFDLGVEYLVWSPDGRWICVVAKSWTPDLADLTDEERGRRPKRITTFPYRFDNRGWLHDRFRHLWLVDPSGAEEPRRLTEGDFDESMPAWHPDGTRIAFVTDRGPRLGLDAGADVYEVTLEGALSSPVERGGWLAPVYSPEGVLHLAGDPQTDYPRLQGLWKVESDGVPVQHVREPGSLRVLGRRRDPGVPPVAGWPDL